MLIGIGVIVGPSWIGLGVSVGASRIGIGVCVGPSRFGIGDIYYTTMNLNTKSIV